MMNKAVKFYIKFDENVFVNKPLHYENTFCDTSD